MSPPVRRQGPAAGSSGPLHLPSDDLPRVDGVRPPEGRPGPEKLTGEGYVVQVPGPGHGNAEASGGRRTPRRKPRCE